MPINNFIAAIIYIVWCSQCSKGDTQLNLFWKYLPNQYYVTDITIIQRVSWYWVQEALSSVFPKSSCRTNMLQSDCQCTCLLPQNMLLKVYCHICICYCTMDHYWRGRILFNIIILCSFNNSTVPPNCFFQILCTFGTIFSILHGFSQKVPCVISLLN